MDVIEFNADVEKQIAHALRRISEATENVRTATGTAKSNQFAAQQRNCGILCALTSLRGWKSMPSAKLIQQEIDALREGLEESPDYVSHARIAGEIDAYSTYLDLLSGEGFDMDVARAVMARKWLAGKSNK